jgi:hypothetical protein
VCLGFDYEKRREVLAYVIRNKISSRKKPPAKREVFKNKKERRKDKDDSKGSHRNFCGQVGALS